MNEIIKTIGENIKKYRLLNNYTQEKLAEKLGIAPNTLSNYENGNREPSNDIILKLADIFGISIDDLYSRSFSKLVNPVEIAASTKDHIDLSEVSDRDKEIIMNIINTSKKEN